MAVTPITTTIPTQQIGQTAIQPPATSDKVSFQQEMTNLLNEANQQHLQADQAVEQMVSGKTDNVHDVVLAMAKADLSFRLMLEIRNRLIDSYQEIMRMQV